MPLSIDIGVCTFQRDHIVETLRSLSGLSLKPDWKTCIIVADNDETPSAKQHVDKVAKDCALNVTYIHAPARNISIARNACLAASQADYLAFIDDDEIAKPEWLLALMKKLDETKADIVLGPVQALYLDDAPEWMKKGNFHSTKPVWVHGKIITGYSCNVLMRWVGSKIYSMRFSEQFGRTGGEDTFFFAEAHKKGANIDFAPDALVTEKVTPSRADLIWLLKRSFRSGQTHAVLLLQNKNPAMRLFNILLAAAKADICFIMCILSFIHSEKRHKWLLRGALHTGVVARLMGKPELVQYG